MSKIKSGKIEFVKKTHFPIPAETLFTWHEKRGILERLIPPWEKVEILHSDESIQSGAKVKLSVKRRGIRQCMEVEHRNYQKGRQFCDFQIRGPFKYWHHQHLCHPYNEQESFLEDKIHYSLPCGYLGRLLAGRWVKKQLERTFRYRHEITFKDLVSHKIEAHKGLKNILVSGYRGLVGRALTPYLRSQDHQVIGLSRSPSKGERISWNPAGNRLDLSDLEEKKLDAVVHLAGEGIVQRWTPAAKKRILQSRVQGTRLLSEKLASLKKPPKVMICASGISIYGIQNEEAVDEGAPLGKGFLAEVAQQWEAATAPAIERGIRVVHLRIGLVLSPAGGAMGRMLPFFKWGLGGRIARGQQYMNWIAIDDLIGAIYHCIRQPDLQGPVNAVAPEPVTNMDYTRELGKRLHRPTVLPIPRMGVDLVFGKMGKETLLASQRAKPEQLLKTGYRFRYPTLGSALKHLIR